MKKYIVPLLLVCTVTVLGAEKILLRNLTQQQKAAAFQDASRNCVLLTLNDGSTRIVRHAHSEECQTAAEDGSRVCVIDGVSQKTFPITQESYVQHLKAGGSVPVSLTFEVEKVCEACEGKGKFVSKNERTDYVPGRITGMGNFIGGKEVTHKGMDTVTFCKECNGKGKVKVSETRDIEIALQ
jgi:DnaJ-class molecular chaperone